MSTFKRLAQQMGDTKLRKAALNTGFEDNNTLLHYASGGQYGDSKIVEMLIRQGRASVNYQNMFGETPLLIACKRSHRKIIERLLLARADANLSEYEYGDTPLHVLVRKNNLSLVELIIPFATESINTKNK